MDMHSGACAYAHPAMGQRWSITHQAP